MTTTRSAAAIGIAVGALTLITSSALAQPTITFVGMGDSIGEGVQSADASVATQPYSFLNLMAWRMGAPFPLPLVDSGLFAQVGNMDGRSRIDPTVQTLNLAVSGANAFSILHDAATATSVAQIDTETELVLFPRVGSQIDIAEQLHPQYVACWIGNNDALGAVLAFDHLDASQLTPVADFTASFTQLVSRLDAAGAKAVFGTVPDISSIGYMLNSQDLIRFLGQDYGLAAGSLTTVPAMMLVKLGLLPSSVFTDPDYVLDPAEQQTIRNRINDLNAVIYSTVTAHNMALVDMHGIFQYLSTNTLNLFGVDLTTRFLGGLFSLDGVHPSDIGHGLVAYFFIDALNQRYNANIPQLDGYTLYLLTATDPFIDKDHDGRVTGRFGMGLLETVFSIIGISGDSNDGTLTLPSASTAAAPERAAGSLSAAAMPATTEKEKTRALDEYAQQSGRDLRKMNETERIQAFRDLFGAARSARSSKL